jgi:hypothetical protein
MDDQFSRFDSEIYLAVQQAKDEAADQHAATEINRAAVTEHLAAAWRQFEAASSASGRALEASRSDPASDPQMLSLTWTACDPVRALTLRATSVGGHIHWEIRADFSGVDVYEPDSDVRNGVVPASTLTSDVVHKLIMVLLRQGMWGRGQFPEVYVPGSMNV